MNRKQEELKRLAETKLSEGITHLAFYAGWPNAMTAVRFANKVL